MRLEYSEEADRNLEQIRERYPTAADKIVEALAERARQITLFPRSGTLARGWEDVGLRTLIEGRYRIVYAVGIETVVVLGIVVAAKQR